MRGSFQKATCLLRALGPSELWPRRVDGRRLQAILVVELVLVIAYLSLMMVFSAARPLVAVGVVLQGVAGLLRAKRYWANGATDSAIGWTAAQIEKNRFGIIGFLDGSPRSLAIALGWFCAGAFCAGAAPAPASGILDWMVVVIAAVTVWSGLLVFLLATLALSARTMLIGVGTPRDGVVLRTMGKWLGARDWVSPMVGLLSVAAFLVALSAT